MRRNGRPSGTPQSPDRVTGVRRLYSLDDSVAGAELEPDSLSVSKGVLWSGFQPAKRHFQALRLGLQSSNSEQLPRGVMRMEKDSFCVCVRAIHFQAFLNPFTQFHNSFDHALDHRGSATKCIPLRACSDQIVAAHNPIHPPGLKTHNVAVRNIIMSASESPSGVKARNFKKEPPNLKSSCANLEQLLIVKEISRTTPSEQNQDQIDYREAGQESSEIEQD
ncbi:hypothetical protein C8R45DRAFT_926077 [Mycena sanguinolenta]|nr:hypothetical protein C8R45DRAFT_926077 [Mycena sanguinolenta]